MKIWIVTELFFPSESATAFILTEIATELSLKYDVHVITIDGNYEQDTRRVSDSKGNSQLPFEIIRIKASLLNKNSLWQRILRFVNVSKKLCKALSDRVSKEDTVLSVTNPAFLILLLKSLKEKIGFKYYLLVHDVFPENLIPAGICSSKNPIFPILLHYFNDAYSAPDKLIVLGRDMKDLLTIKTKDKPDIHIVENWGDISILPVYSHNKSNITLQYAGNIGRVQGIKQLIEIIEQVQSDILKFQFYGSGALTKYIENHQNENISYHGSYTRGEHQDILNESDIAIVTLAKGMKGLGVPSKAYNIMAAGRPILFIGDLDSEIALTIQEHNIGWTFDPSEKRKIKSFLNNLTLDNLQEIQEKGKRARVICESLFSKDIILKKFSSLFF